MTDSRRHQVIIIGGGPVGVALAVELGQRGVECVVVERHREVGRVPKGQYLSPRSVEHFHFWNCVADLRAARVLPAGYPTGGIRVFGDLTSDHWLEAAYHQDPLGLYAERAERLPQYLTEEVLRRRAAALGCVTFRFGETATRVEQDSSGVRVRVTREAPPHEEVLEAGYAVGCDGTRSLVRRQLGISSRGTDLGHRMVLAVFSSPQLHDKLSRFREHSTFQVISPELGGVWQFFGRVRLGVSWFFHGPVAPDTGSDDRDYVHAVMQRAAGFSFPVTFEHIGFWDLRAEVAGAFRHGRVFIAGDAAHSHPPYGAYGLNTGLEDAVNLGWKLAAALGGWGGDALLDSYGQERQPVCAQTAEDVIMGGILRDREWLARLGPERDGRAFANAWAAHSAVRSGDYEPHYAGSAVVTGPPGAACGVHAVPSPLARAGYHLASRHLADGASVFARLGTGFTLLAFGRSGDVVAGFASAASSLGVPLRVVRDRGGTARRDYGADLVLARPDQFVAWAGDAVPGGTGPGGQTGAAGLLAQVTGRG